MSLDGAFQTGTVTAFSGANGLLQALLDFITGTEVTGASTSGSGAGPYTATLTTPVGLGRTVINYTFSSVDYTATDDGSGNFTGTNISSASINHTTGAFTATFTGTPDSAPTLDYLYGDDGQDWRLHFQRNTRDNLKTAYTEPFGSDCEEVILHNTGLSGAENVLIGIREWQYVAQSAWGWDLCGYLTYTADQIWGVPILDDIINSDSYDSTWEHFTQCPMMPLIDDTMNYWFYSNRQRIIVVVRCGTPYECCYLGFGNRHGNPSDYPYPLVIKGSAYGNVKTTTVGQTTHAYLPYSSASILRMLFNVLPGNNWADNTSSNLTFLFPETYWDDEGELSETPLKKQCLMSPVVGINVAQDATLWDLDGVYHCAGVGLQSEDLIKTEDGLKYRVFEDVTRSTYNDFMGIAESAYTSTSTSTTTTTSSTTTTTT